MVLIDKNDAHATLYQSATLKTRFSGLKRHVPCPELIVLELSLKANTSLLTTACKHLT